MDESISLDKKFQSKFARKVKKVKERVQASGGIIPQTNNTSSKQLTKPQHGLVYIGHIPHGFYENEMLAYFKQFGKVSNLRVCRSRATGRSKGYGFVEFADAEVAKIAAETMDNYLMFNRRLIAKYVTNDKVFLHRRYRGPAWTEKSFPLKTLRDQVNQIKNRNIDDKTHLSKCRQMITQVNRSLKKLHDLGINYNFKAVDDDNNLNANIIQSKDTVDNEESKDSLTKVSTKKVGKQKKKMLKKLSS